MPSVVSMRAGEHNHASPYPRSNSNSSMRQRKSLQEFPKRPWTPDDDSETGTDRSDASSCSPESNGSYDDDLEIYHIVKPTVDARCGFAMERELNGVNAPLKVKHVHPDTPADFAGLRVGMQIVSVDGNASVVNCPHATADLLKGIMGTIEIVVRKTDRLATQASGCGEGLGQEDLRGRRPGRSAKVAPIDIYY